MIEVQIELFLRVFWLLPAYLGEKYVIYFEKLVGNIWSTFRQLVLPKCSTKDQQKTRFHAIYWRHKVFKTSVRQQMMPKCWPDCKLQIFDKFQLFLYQKSWKIDKKIVDIAQIQVNTTMNSSGGGAVTLDPLEYSTWPFILTFKLFGLIFALSLRIQVNRRQFLKDTFISNATWVMEIYAADPKIHLRIVFS